MMTGKDDNTADIKLADYYNLIVYKAGKPFGIKRQYFISGEIFYVTPYSKGKKNGIECCYYKNGKLRVETTYVNGIKNGIEKCYYENGKIKSESPFINGKITGIDKVYYENGNLESEFSKSNYYKHGTAKEYYEDGKLRTESHYMNDTLNGTVKNYYESGEVMSESQLKKGLEIGIRYFSNKGHEITLEQIQVNNSGFSWADTTFKSYSKRIVNFQYLCDGPCDWEPCYETEDNHFVYDTVVNFLRAYPSIEIEIAFYVNISSGGYNLGGISYNDYLSRSKADYMKYVLVQKGINPDRIIAVGYGNRNPAYKHEKIAHPKDEEHYYMINRKGLIEIIIVENGSETK
ncbi:MAG TPA: OmpA family protein [Bacteroidia bacterium]|nr:OmpA family protein [Bacteroidia bacterium]